MLAAALSPHFWEGAAVGAKGVGSAEVPDGANADSLWALWRDAWENEAGNELVADPSLGNWDGK